MKDYILALLKVAIPYLIVAGLSLSAGMWIQSGKTPVLPKTITKYIPSPDGYIDLPKYNFVPAVRYILTDPAAAEKDTVFIIDSTYAPMSWIGNYDLFQPEEAVKLTNNAVFISYFNPQDQTYVIDEYTIPEPTWRLRYSLSAATNIVEQPYQLYLGITGSIYYRRVGIGSTILANSLTQPPMILLQLKYRLQ